MIGIKSIFDADTYFDSDEIKVAQVITRNKYSSGGMSSGLQAVKIPEWNSVQPVEYLR